MAYDGLMLRSITAACCAALLTAVPVTGAPCEAACGRATTEAAPGIARTGHGTGGNRLVAARGPLVGERIDIALPGTATWVLPDPADRGTSWVVALADGSLLRVDESAQEAIGQLEPGEPPIATIRFDGELVVRSALRAHDWFDDPLPDARVVSTPDGRMVALVGPTDRYAHGVLGDELEASAIEIRASAEEAARIDVEARAVIEGLAPMIADLDGDDVPEIIVTVSDAEVGARVVSYGVDGERRAVSKPIGRGYRWLHQVGVGATGPAGEIELIAVRTPHIGGIVEAYRLAGDRLERVAATPGYSSHRLGSPNLDMALLADVDGSAGPEVVVPTQDMATLALLARSGDGFEQVDVLPLEGVLSTNLAATPDSKGRLVLAAGTEDGRLRVFR